MQMTVVRLGMDGNKDSFYYLLDLDSRSFIARLRDIVESSGDVSERRAEVQIMREAATALKELASVRKILKELDGTASNRLEVVLSDELLSWAE